MGDADSLPRKRRKVVEHHAFHTLARVGLLVALHLGAKVHHTFQVVIDQKARQIALSRLVQGARPQKQRRPHPAPVGCGQTAQVAGVAQPLEGDVAELGKPGNCPRKLYLCRHLRLGHGCSLSREIVSPMVAGTELERAREPNLSRACWEIRSGLPPPRRPACRDRHRRLRPLPRRKTPRRQRPWHRPPHGGSHSP